MEQTYRFVFGDSGATDLVVDPQAAWFARVMGLSCSHGGFADLFVVDTSGGRYPSSRFTLTDSRVDTASARLSLRSDDGRIGYTISWEHCPRTGIALRQDTVTNTGESDLEMTRALARFVLAPGSYSVYAQDNRWSHENQGSWRPLPNGSFSAACEGGRTCQGSTPFMGVRAAGGAHGLAVHLLPLGNWVIRATAHSAGAGGQPYLILELGPSDEDFHLVLAPGVSYELPRILLHDLPRAEIHRASGRLHRYLLDHLLPAPRSAPPVVYNTWFDVFDVLEVGRLRRQLHAARDVGCEIFVVDAGWFGSAPGSWAVQVGDWQESQDTAFRGAMGTFVREVEGAGLRFGLWMEPERIRASAPIYRRHPEWFIPASPWQHDEGDYWPDLCNQGVREYITGEMERLIETYNLAWMKVDCNIVPGRDPARTEMVDYYRHWHVVLDEIRRRHPEVYLEACASGGMRLEVSTLEHYDAHFLTDTVDPVHVLRISEGAFLRVPPGRVTKWAVMRSVGKHVVEYGKSPEEAVERVVAPRGAVWDPAQTVDVDFVCAAMMPGVLGLSGDLAGLPADATEKIRGHIAFYKEWRGFIAAAHAHLLTQPESRENATGWSCLQLQDADGGRNLVFAYRLGESGSTCTVYPEGLQAETMYTVTEVLGGGEHATARGRELMDRGIDIELEQPFRASILCIEVTDR